MLMAPTAWLMLSVPVSCADFICIPYFSMRIFFLGALEKYGIQPNPHTIQELKDNISHAVAAIRITTLHRVYLNMVTARLLVNCSNTLRNINTNATENITGKRAKRKAGYFFVAHSVYIPKERNKISWCVRHLKHLIFKCRH